MKKANIPVFVAHLGCPNDCVFCNQKRITGTDGKMTAKKCAEIIEEWLSFIKGEAEIAFFGGSFTGIDLKEQNELLSVAASYLSDKRITGIRLSTRPDYINEKITENLLKYGVTTVELGAQSTDDEVLFLSKRGHTREDIFNASRMIKEAGIDLGLQMMTGLPGSDNEKDLKTCLDFIKMAPSQVRIYPTLVLKDTCLLELYKRGEYEPQTLSEAAELTARLYDRFDSFGIKVIRTGLQPSSSLDKSFVAGPYHPSFGEIAQSRLIFLRIVNYIEKNSVDFLEISCEERLKSKLYGQKKANINELSQRLNGNVTVKDAPSGSGIQIGAEKIFG